MSTTVLSIIPCAAGHVPDADRQDSALEIFRRLVGHAYEVSAIVHEEVTLIDAGGNFDSVACPACGARLDRGWWSDRVTRAWESRFAELGVDLPCCHARRSLNDLTYDFPMGFARFVLEANEPENASFLDASGVRELEGALGAPLRQVLARY